jgi:hypothetical protein
VTGPNGSAIDIGDRNMVDPAQLREFIEWGKQTYPAERYAVVLWNHGGGYAGLLQDITSAGASLMSMSDLRTALDGAGTIDLLDFDMCLMGGYETLATLKGLAKYVVFSEEVVPGEGLPYKEVVQAFNAHAADDGRTIAGAIADAFHASFANQQPSTTISAYDMAAFDAFDDAMGSFADALLANAAALAPEVSAAAAGSQKYTYRELTDIEDFLDQLDARGNAGALQGSITSCGRGARRLPPAQPRPQRVERRRRGREPLARAALRAAERRRRRPARRGGPAQLRGVQGALPQPAVDALPRGVPAGGADVRRHRPGNSRFESFLVWDPAAVEEKADVDLWILEPNGNVYVPTLGTVTPNGSLTGDSYDTGTNYEGYLSNRFIQNGQYLFIASLYADPNDYQPQYDFVFRDDPRRTSPPRSRRRRSTRGCPRSGRGRTTRRPRSTRWPPATTPTCSWPRCSPWSAAPRRRRAVGEHG